MTEIEKLEQAITALEAQRAILGDGVVETALAPLREKLAFYKAALQVSASVPLSTPRSATAPSLTQRRKIVTVLFADMPGFTAMSEKMDAEELRDAMNRLWERLDAVILSFGGKIDKHIGDAVMALWGAVEAREDDPERAIHAALGMQKALQEISFPGKEHATMRIGINTGTVLLGSIGTQGEVTAMGDAVNVASRLEQASPHGGVLISHDTYRHVQGVFDVEPQSPLEIKGKSEPLHTYLVYAAKPRAFRLHTRGVEGVETHMIGRDAEFERLCELFDDMLGHNQRATLTVIGEAGIGKSRLLYEFNAWAELRPAFWWVFQGRPTASITQSPYALLRDIFAFRFQIQDNDSLVVAHQKFERGFDEFLPANPRRREMAHFIGHLVGFDFSESPHLRGILSDPRQIRRQALYFILQFFGEVARNTPVLLMLDDLHWADLGSLEAIVYLLENLPANTPMMVLALARPLLLERFPQWQTQVAGEILQLQPLDKHQSRYLVNEILRKVIYLPPVLQELIVGGAEGNPFYVEELIKMLIDEGVIIPSEEEWGVEPARLAQVRIPPTLTEVLQARLDSLQPAERSALQLASVVGRVFWSEAVAHLNRDAREETFSALQRKELVSERRPSSFAGTREYIFRHSLLHDVTYDTLLKRQRAVYHASAAEWLDTISGDRRGEYLALIAGHYEKAGIPDKAAASYIEAGTRALGLSAFAEARATFEKALTFLRDQEDVAPGQLTALELKLADTFSQLGDYPAAQQYAQSALISARQADSRTGIAESLATLGMIVLYMGDYRLAQDYLLEALPLAREAAIDKTGQTALGRVLVHIASTEWRLGNYVSAQNAARESYEIASSVGDVTTVMMALNRLGVVSGALGKSDDEIRYYQQAYEIAQSVGNRERAAVSLNNLGAVMGEQHRWQEAREYYERANQISIETGARQQTALHLINIGDADVMLGELDSARKHLGEGITLALELGAYPVVVSGMVYFAFMIHKEGNTGRALEIIGAAKTNPAWDSESDREVAMIFKEWGISESEMMAGMEKGQELDFEAVLKELISPLPPPSPEEGGD